MSVNQAILAMEDGLRKKQIEEDDINKSGSVWF